MGMAGLRVQERAAFKSVVQFFILFFALSSMPEPNAAAVTTPLTAVTITATKQSAYSQPVLEIARAVGPVFTRELLICSLRRSPRSALPFLSDLLYQLMSHYSVMAAHWVKLALGLPSTLSSTMQAVGESTTTMQPPCLDFGQLQITDTARQLFVKQLIGGNRQPRRFKDAVRDFAVKCRGLDGTAFAEI